MKSIKEKIALRFIATTSSLMLILFPLLLVAQVPDTNKYWYMGIDDPDANFYKIRQKGWDYFNAHPELDTLKGTGFKDLIRWEQFWQDRVYQDGNQNPGSFSIAYNSMLDFIDDRDDYFQNPVKENQSWNFFGPDNLTTQTMGFVSCIDVVHSGTNIDTIYAGTNASGLFKKINGGIDWVCITDTIGMPGLGVQDVLIDPHNHSDIYIATGITTYGRGYGNGIYKSTNSGLSWQNIFSVSNPEQKVVNKMLLDPENSSWLYALVNDEVYRTTDGGQNWTMIFDELTQPPSTAYGRKKLMDMEFEPGSNNIIYISSNGFYYNVNNAIYRLESEVWKCENADEEENLTWVRIDDDSWPYNERIELAVSDAAPEIVFASFNYKIDDNASDTFALFKSNDNGDNWNTFLKRATSSYYGSAFSGVGTSRHELVVSPNDTDVVYVGGFYITKITDNGQKIKTNGCASSLCNNFHVDVRELILVSGSESGSEGKDDILFAGNDGGISKTVTGSQYWTNINGSGLTITQFYGLANSNNFSNYISAGCQDNGLYINRPNDNQWFNKGSGDGYECLNNDVRPLESYETYYSTRPAMHYTPDGGYSFKNYLLPDESPRADWPFLMDPIDPDILYTGLHDIYKIIKTFDEETQEVEFVTEAISEFSESPHYVNTGAKLSALGIWAENPLVIYAAFENPTWQNVTCQEKKLFRTINGGMNWVDLTCNLDFTQGLGITDILVDPEDSNKVWLALGGFSSQAETNRVIYTEDCFVNYTDISDGLPNLPVNSIKMASKDNHQLFLANDAGVFYRDDLMNQWNIYVEGTPVTIFSDLEISQKYNLIWASTFGRGIWYTEGMWPCPEVSYTDTININSDTTWTNEVRLHHHLKVSPGAHLTIKGTVFVGEENKIIVDRSGTLTLDGCLITNSCNGDYWQGIEVWGNAEKSQYDDNEQGVVELKNGATIENAVVAIATIKTDTTFHDTSWSGGIIKALNANFRNNRTHIQFYGYANFYPADSIFKNEIPNLSYFTNCDFSLDHLVDVNQTFGLKLDHVNGIPFADCRFKYYMEIDTSLADYNISLIFLQNSSDIKFKGCEFKNEYEYIDFSWFTPLRGIGIYSYNSSFSITPYRTPSGSKFSQFSKLTYGIKALSINSERQFSVDSCSFEMTARGIYNSGTRYQTITSNTFCLPSNVVSAQFPYYGIYLDYCSQYHVEDNLIYPSREHYDINCLGIIVNNSGDEFNMIYRNYFRKLGYGIIAQNDNRGDDEILGSGLKLKCNEFESVMNDIYVGPEDAITRKGISKFQGFFGTQDAPAGNLFSHYSPPLSDYYNTQKSVIYFHHDPAQSPSGLNLVPWYYSSGSITIQSTDDPYDSLSCQPKLTLSSRETLKNSMLLESNSIDTTTIIFEAWEDGGNTDLLQQEIDYSTPDEGYDLRNDLLSESPYLSDTVMINAAEKEDVLTDALIRDVLVANPQAAKSEEVMAKLDQRVLLLPDYMIEEIEQGIFSVSQKEMLEAELAYYYQQRELARIALIQSFITDTTIISIDSLVNFYSGEDERMLQYDLAFLYLAENDSANAMNTLSSIPVNYTLTTTQEDLHDQYLDYFDIYLNLQSAGSNEEGLDPAQLDPAQINELYSIENSNIIPVSAYARAVLQVYDSLKYYEPIILPDSNFKSFKIPQRKSNEKLEKKSQISIYPNPADKFITVEYQMSEPGYPALIKITDQKGIVIKEIPLKSIQNKIIIGTGNLVSGLYICNLVVNQSVKESVKIIVNH